MGFENCYYKHVKTDWYDCVTTISDGDTQCRYAYTTTRLVRECTSSTAYAANTDDTEPRAKKDSDIPVLLPSLTRVDRIIKLLECDSLVFLKNFQGDLQNWTGLTQHTLSQGLKNYLSSVGGFQQTLPNARGPIANLDEYSVNISNLSIPPEALLDHIRRNLNDFIDTSISSFDPYPGIDNSAWNTSSPIGTMFSIQFKDPTALNTGINPVDGTVITSYSSAEKWIFTTSWTPEDNHHPVSGHREFGFTRNNNGTVTFYTRGVDRITTQFFATANFITSALPGSRRGAIFDGGDLLWRSFQKKVNQYVKSIGGNSSIEDPKVNGIDWDLVSDMLLGRVEIPDCE